MECAGIILLYIVLVQCVGTLYLLAVHDEVAQQGIQHIVAQVAFVAGHEFPVHVLHLRGHGILLALGLGCLLVQVEAVAHQQACIFGAAQCLLVGAQGIALGDAPVVAYLLLGERESAGALIHHRVLDERHVYVVVDDGARVVLGLFACLALLDECRGLLHQCACIVDACLRLDVEHYTAQQVAAVAHAALQVVDALEQAVVVYRTFGAAIVHLGILALVVHLHVQAVAGEQHHRRAPIDGEAHQPFALEAVEVLLAGVRVKLGRYERCLQTVEIHHFLLIAIHLCAQHGFLLSCHRRMQGCAHGQQRCEYTLSHHISCVFIVKFQTLLNQGKYTIIVCNGRQYIPKKT